MKTTYLPVILSTLFIAIIFSGSAWGDAFGSGANTFDIAFVPIGSPGNVADTTGDPNPAGSVPYTFRMGKYEISEQIIAKANALGGLGIAMDARGPDKPATSVSWNEAARLVNWLNSSTGAPPAYKFASQPGEDGYDSNDDILLWTPTDAGYNPGNRYRNTLARYFLPSMDEWYKVAFFDPVSGVYHDYATGSDTPPTPVSSGTAPATAVFCLVQASSDCNVSPDGPADVTLAGGLSPYGTMAQGGNVHEWIESAFGVELSYEYPKSSHYLRGGYWGQFDYVLSSSWNFTIGYGIDRINGFRVASIPEPASLTLTIAGILVFGLRRGRR